MKTSLPTVLRNLTAAWLMGALSPHVCADGTLTHMSGTVSIRKADGMIQPGIVGARAYPGDTVVTGANSYVRMEMTDTGEIVLRPDSQLKIDAYAYNATKPAEDNFVFSMLKGGLRTVTGLIGKRGNKDAYQLKTDTATIGIRGTQFDMRVCAGNCGVLADGTYVAVRFGAVQTSNALGSLPVSAGQVAHVPPQRSPVMLPRDPGIGFTPPVVIPKLDEKKKVQAAAAAATAAPEQAKPAAGGQATQTQTQGKAEGKVEGKAEGKTDAAPGKDAAPADTGTKPATQSPAGTAPATQASPPPLAAPTSQAPAGGMDCSVQ